MAATTHQQQMNAVYHTVSEFCVTRPYQTLESFDLMASLWNKSVITCLLGAYSRYTSNDIHFRYIYCIPLGGML